MVNASTHNAQEVGMVETLNREGGDDRSDDIAFQKTLEEIQNLPEYTHGFISDRVHSGIGDIVMVGVRGRRAIPTVAGNFSLRRTSVVHPLDSSPEDARN